MTEPTTSHVEQQVQQRIAAARVKIQAAKERREGFAAARRRGLAFRHAQRLRNLAAAEQRRLDAEQQDQDDDLDDEQDDLDRDDT